jgi:UTP--glucose-1-phosphate uridylyltransferase
MQCIVEKPSPETAPSNLAVIGRYILTPGIFEHLVHLGKGAGGEIQLTDGIARLLKEEQALTYRFEGKRYDCGSKLGYLMANVEHGLLHEELRDEFLAYLKQLVNDI